MTKLFQSIKKRFNTFNAKRELMRYAPSLNEASKGLQAEQLVNLICNEPWERFFWTKQVTSEFIGMAKLIEKINPEIVVEIGTNTGGTFFVLTKLAKSTAKVISIDLPDGMGGGGFPDYKTDFFKSFARDNQALFFLKTDSHLESTLNHLKEILQGIQIDYLFLDGDHSFEGIKKDFEMYSPFVRNGGLIGFHDIKVYPQDHWIKVGDFWNQVKTCYKYTEFLDKTVHWGGIGILEYEK